MDMNKHEIDAVAKTLTLLGNAKERQIGREALNGYVYQRRKIAIACGIVRGFRAFSR